MSRINWDKFVGYWVRDVPYFWVEYNRNGWKGNKRYYIFPPNSIGTEDPKCVLKCNNTFVENYFIYQEIKFINLEFGKLKMNGYDVYIPQNYLRKEGCYICHLYDFLGVDIPQSVLKKNMIVFPGEKIFSPPSVKIYSPEIKTPDESKMKLGNIDYMNLFLWYLSYFRKNSKICIPVNKHGIKDNYPNDSRSVSVVVTKEDFSDMNIVGTTLKKSFRDFSKLISLCLKSKEVEIILLDFGLFYLWQGYLGHATLLLIDKRLKNGKMTVYHFDPHGKTKYGDKKVKKAIIFLLDKLGIKENKYKIIGTEITSPVASFQSIEPKSASTPDKDDNYVGYCEIWTLWMIDTVLKNPNIDLKSLPRLALRNLSKKHQDFRKFIRRFSKHIEEYGKMMRRKDDYSNEEKIYKVVEKKYDDYVSHLKKSII